jgi:hypothetical protein
MVVEHLTAEELVQHVWNTAQERTQLEMLLSEALARALDAAPAENFGEHD